MGTSEITSRITPRVEPKPIRWVSPTMFCVTATDSSYRPRNGLPLLVM